MGSPVLKRSVVIAGHKTSVRLEDEFWSGLKEIVAVRSMTLAELVTTVERACSCWSFIGNGRRAGRPRGRTAPAP